MVTTTEEHRLPDEEKQPSQCLHHWLIDSPGGPISKGVCRRCGVEQEFKNFLEGARWDDDRPNDQVVLSGGVPRSVYTDGSLEDEN